jgi:hypothetical protein
MNTIFIKYSKDRSSPEIRDISKSAILMCAKWTEIFEKLPKSMKVIYTIPIEI